MADKKNPIVIQDEKFGPMFAFAEDVEISAKNDHLVRQMANKIYAALQDVGDSFYSIQMGRHLQANDIWEALLNSLIPDNK